MGRRPMCLVCLLLITGILLWQKAEGVWNSPLPPQMEAEVEAAEKVTVCGTLLRQVQGENSHSLYLKHTYLTFQSKIYPIQTIRIFFSETCSVQAGSVLKIEGSLYTVQKERNPGAFDSRIYYAAQDIWYLMNGERILEVRPGKNPLPVWLEQLYGRLCNVMDEISQGDGGILKAMLLGEKSDVEEQTKDYYQMAGMLHLLAVSGLHLTFLGMGAVRILGTAGAGMYLSWGLSVVLVWLYGFLIHGAPSAWRAILMFTVMAGGRLLGRSYDMLSAFALAAVLLLLHNPANLFYSGFLLSFGAVLGLGLCSGAEDGKETRPEKKGRWRKVLLWLKQNMRASLGVQAVTLPLVLSFYYEISLFGIFWNLLILPTAGILMGFGLLGLLGGCLWIPLGQLLILPGKCLAWLYLQGAKAGAGLPFCIWTAGEPSLWKILVYYFVLFLFLMMWKRRRLRILSGILLGISVVLFGIRIRTGLTVTCLDVGQGDGIVLELPGGETFLVDGGSSSESQVGRYVLLPYLKSRGISRLTGIFVTHSDEDHISGILELLQAVRDDTTALEIDALYLPDWKLEQEELTLLKQLGREAGARVLALPRGAQIRAGKVRLRVLHPQEWNMQEDLNGGSLVLELACGKFRGLFTGDIGRTQEQELLSLLEPCDFLKVAHHGSGNSSTEEFLQAVRPAYGFISCGENNWYGHPASETLDRLEKAGCRYWTTMEYGALSLWTDGEKVQVRGHLGNSGG